MVYSIPKQSNAIFLLNCIKLFLRIKILTILSNKLMELNASFLAAKMQVQVLMSVCLSVIVCKLKF